MAQTNRPTRIEIDCQTGVETIVELTDEEIAQAQEWSAQREAERAAEAAEAERIAALKISARNKLVAGEPLTEEEAATIVL